jgi:hypothetical protein
MSFFIRKFPPVEPPTRIAARFGAGNPYSHDGIFFALASESSGVEIDSA